MRIDVSKRIDAPEEDGPLVLPCPHSDARFIYNALSYYATDISRPKDRRQMAAALAVRVRRGLTDQPS